MRLLSVCMGVLAIIALSTSMGFAQDDEDRGSSRDDRLRRIEEAIQRLESALPDVEIEGELAGQIEDALGEFDELTTDIVAADRFVIGIVLDPEQDGDGIGVSQVVPDSAAQEAEIMAGDLILAVNGEEISDPKQLIDVVQENGDGEPLELTLSRDGETLTVKLTPKKVSMQDFIVPGIEFKDFEIPNIQIPHVEQEELRIPHMVIPEIQNPGLYKELAPQIEKLRESMPEGGFQVMPPVILGQGESKEEMAELRKEMAELRAQMKMLAEQLKAVQESLDDDD